MKSSRKERRGDYSRKHYESPRRRPRGIRNLPWRRWAIPIAVIFALVGWIWFLAFSSAFRITDISVSGNDKIQTWEIRDALDTLMARHYWFVIPKRSLILLSESEIREYLLSQFVLDDVEITKSPPHAIKIAVKERVSTIFMILPDGSQAMLDLDGNVVRTYRPETALEITRGYGPTIEQRLNPAEGLPVLFSDYNETLALRGRTVDPAIVRATIRIPDLIEKTFGAFVRTDEIHVENFRTTTMRIFTTEGWSIYLDAEKDLDVQMSNAKTVIAGKLGDDRRTLEYVDVRFGEKIFIKTR